jgi:hypothetical protein
MKGSPVASADTSAALAVRPPATRMQHVIRLLVILAECGEDVKAGDSPGTAKVIRSELRLQALDFWLRNPDYLADELVTKVEAGEQPKTFPTPWGRRQQLLGLSAPPGSEAGTVVVRVLGGGE